MSFQLMAWASDQTTGSPTRKAVLMALANAANHHTGRCHPSVERLAWETECSERTVRRALDDLEAAGFIARHRVRRPGGTLGTYHFTFPLADVVSGGPPVTDAGRPPDTVAAQNLEVPNREEQALHTHREQPVTVSRRRVTDDEREFAEAVLAVWNLATGQRLAAPEWKAKIIMRYREHRDATVEDHAALIALTLLKPWWDGPPTPSVIYGSAAQFERSVEAARAGQTGGAADAARIAQEAIDERRRS